MMKSKRLKRVVSCECEMYSSILVTRKGEQVTRPPDSRERSGRAAVCSTAGRHERVDGAPRTSEMCTSK